jgi:glycerophosphoryl diester phosphodiesterase
MHDADVSRTTDGRGAVADLTLAQLRALDAGARFGLEFAGERIPTLEEALDALPRDLWINLQIKRGEDVVERVVDAVVAQDRLHQCVLACGNAAVREARRLAPDVLVCNLVRQRSRLDYVAHCAATGSDFVQLHHLRGRPTAEEMERARDAGLCVNFFCAPDVSPGEVDALLAAGVDFVLVDDVSAALEVAAGHGIERRV